MRHHVNLTPFVLELALRHQLVVALGVLRLRPCQLEAGSLSELVGNRLRCTVAHHQRVEFCRDSAKTSPEHTARRVTRCKLRLLNGLNRALGHNQAVTEEPPSQTGNFDSLSWPVLKSKNAFKRVFLDASRFAC